MNTKNHPGVYVPPPLIYLACFVLSRLVQKIYPLQTSSLHTSIARAAGVVFIFLYLLFFATAMSRFIRSKNTLVTIKPATLLETSGIYSFTRNPMYLSLICLYCGLAVFLGNWWTLIFLPLLIVVVQFYVIKKEEQYLQQAFGSNYEDYKRRVRRWI